MGAGRESCCASCGTTHRWRANRVVSHSCGATSVTSRAAREHFRRLFVRPSRKAEMIIRALHTKQGPNLDVYAFFVRGADIIRLADISRIARDESDVLKGFQRPEIRSH